MKKDGFNVSIVLNPTTTLSEDVAATRQIIAQAKGPVVLVGHSYGGVVITEAGNDPKVSKLVYITAFAPDKGESVASLIKNPPPGAPVPPILPPQNGFLFLDKAKFAESFAADVGAEKAAFMANSQVPWGVAALEGAVTEPAWRKKPSWYLVVTEDRIDSSTGSAVHVKACRLHSGRNQGKPCGLCVQAGRRDLDHQERRTGLTSERAPPSVNNRRRCW